MARPNIPTKIKEFNGTYRPDRSNQAEPKLKAKMPTPPGSLTPAAKKVWPHIVKMLSPLRVITDADNAALESLCDTYANLIAARKALAKYGGEFSYQTTTQNGSIMWKSYPEVGQIAELDRRLRHWLGVFGATPADRSRVSALAADEQDDDDALFMN